MVLKDKTGRVYGKLTVIKRAPNKGHHTYWTVRCDCGYEYNTSSSGLSRRTECKFCSSKTNEKASDTHRKAMWKRTVRTRWKGMHHRCYNPKRAAYYRYGGRGIIVEEEWHNFDNYLKWCERYLPDLSLEIDRINNDGNYSSENCRVVNRSTNMANADSSRGEYRGVSTRKDGMIVGQIRYDKKYKYLGSFKTEKEAALAYDKFVIDNKLPHIRNFNEVNQTS